MIGTEQDGIKTKWLVGAVRQLVSSFGVLFRVRIFFRFVFDMTRHAILSRFWCMKKESSPVIGEDWMALFL